MSKPHESHPQDSFAQNNSPVSLLIDPIVRGPLLPGARLPNGSLWALRRPAGRAVSSAAADLPRWPEHPEGEPPNGRARRNSASEDPSCEGMAAASAHAQGGEFCRDRGRQHPNRFCRVSDGLRGIRAAARSGEPPGVAGGSLRVLRYELLHHFRRGIRSSAALARLWRIRIVGHCRPGRQHHHARHRVLLDPRAPRQASGYRRELCSQLLAVALRRVQDQPTPDRNVGAIEKAPGREQVRNDENLRTERETFVTSPGMLGYWRTRPGR